MGHKDCCFLRPFSSHTGSYLSPCLPMLHCPAPAAGRRDLTYKGSVPNHPTYNRGLPLPHWRHPPPGRHSCPHRYPISKREASKSMWTPDLSKPNPALQQLPQPNPQSSGCSAAVPLPSLSSLGIPSSQFLVVQPLQLCRCLSSLITIVPSLPSGLSHLYTPITLGQVTGFTL